MSTQRKIDAARANGAKSRGPKTEAGKQKSSLNAIKHGFNARLVVLPTEDRDAFDALLESYVADLDPQNEIELDLIHQMVAAKWRQQRLWGIETKMLDLQIARDREHVEQNWEEPGDNVHLAEAFDSLAGGQDRSFIHLTRYEDRLRRLYERALRDLRLLRAQPKPPTQNEPNDPKPQARHQGPRPVPVPVTEPRPQGAVASAPPIPHALAPISYNRIQGEAFHS